MPRLSGIERERAIGFLRAGVLAGQVVVESISYFYHCETATPPSTNWNLA